MTGVKMPQVAVFIDWHNMAPVRYLAGRKVKFDGLLSYVHTLGNLRGAFVYMVDFKDHIPEHERIDSRAVQALENRNFIVRQKVVKRRYDPLTRKVTAEGNMDVELTIDIMDTLLNVGSVIDKIVFFSGDSDFCPVIRRIQRHRSKNPIRTLVISRKEAISPELARQSNEFLFLEKIADELFEPRCA